MSKSKKKLKIRKRFNLKLQSKQNAKTEIRQNFNQQMLL